MTNRLTAIQTGLATVLQEISALNKDLISDANNHKATILNALTQLRSTQDTLDELGAICGDTGLALLNVSETCATVTDKIEDTLFSLEDIPLGNYETFVDFCAQCGAEVHDDQLHERTAADEVLCADCAFPEPDTSPTVELVDGEVTVEEVNA